MKQTSIAIIAVSDSGLEPARLICREIPDTIIYTKSVHDDCRHLPDIAGGTGDLFARHSALVFIGAMGICVRSIAPHIRDKHTDPAVINVDSGGKYVVSVLSGHVGGANELTLRIAHILGAEGVVTTQSDGNGLWPLDVLGDRYGWTTDCTAPGLNRPIIAFVNRRPTALLLDVCDEGTRFLERTKPPHVDIYRSYTDIDPTRYEVLIAVTPYRYPAEGMDVVYYHPKVLHLGIGCRKGCLPDGVGDAIAADLERKGIALASLADLSTIDIKSEEPLLKDLSDRFRLPVRIYTAAELDGIPVPNPSAKVKEVTTVSGVSEPAALKSAGGGMLVVQKQKGKLTEGNDYTYAVAIRKSALRQGHIEIVGAGPGDPDLISVRGRHFLEAADLILYAGSLVPVELTECAKQGAVVRSSASMDLPEQFALMKTFYDEGKLVVRLHTGDPCIYGAIQEQMAFFDRYGMSYHITPGISSFQAAAAALHSQFTIPERVQTIILTRGEGRTPMPEREKLHLLAKSRSTMCIFLSASVIDNVQEELLMHYPPETPVAACYKLTWKDERIYRGVLRDLAAIVKDNELTLTTMIVVGEAIGNREGLSRLYDPDFKHLFRPD